MRNISKIMSHLLRVVWVTLFLSGIVVSVNAQSNGDAKNVLSEARSAWDTYLQKIKSCELECKTTQKEKGKITAEQTTRLVYEAPFFVREIISGKKERVRGHTSKYAFAMERPLDGDWNVTDVTPSNQLSEKTEIFFPDQSNDSENQQTHARFAVPTLVAGLKLTFIDLLPVISSKPEFNILDVKNETVGGEKIVRIVYSFEPKEDIPNQLARSGEVSLIPDKYWLIKTAKVQCREPGQKERFVESIVNEYVINDIGMPLIKKHSSVSSGAGLDGFATEEVYIYSSPARDLPKNRLTLSYYGVPEPDFPEPEIVLPESVSHSPVGGGGERHTVSGFHYFLLVVGILIIAFIFWRMYQNR